MVNKNGLSISLMDFEKLPTKRRLVVLYENQVETIRLIKGYKFYYKITTVIGSFLVLSIGFLFKLYSGMR